MLTSDPLDMATQSQHTMELHCNQFRVTRYCCTRNQFTIIRKGYTKTMARKNDFSSVIKVRGKGKVHPRTGHESPEGEKCSSTLSLTFALDRVGGQRHASAALPPGKTRYPLYSVTVCLTCPTRLQQFCSWS